MIWNTNLWNELERMRGDMNSLFEDNFQDGRTSTYPPVNVYDDKEDLTVLAELPGMAKDDVNVSFTDGSLTLSGKREPLVEDGKYSAIRNERVEGDFKKSLRIPYKLEVDKISAQFKNGVLTIKMPKAEEAKPKQIQVNIN
ncbi:Hsp20/alpha crystallin family protein [Fibrobacterota bacterium]